MPQCKPTLNSHHVANESVDKYLKFCFSDLKDVLSSKETAHALYNRNDCYS